MKINKAGWDCNECGWIHHPDDPCACPPEVNCDCCFMEINVEASRLEKRLQAELRKRIDQ